MVNNKNSIKIKRLKNNLKNILDEFKKLDFNNEENINAVSYTHLTLPTILLV